MILWWVDEVRGLVIDTNTGTTISVKEFRDEEENKVHLSVVVTTTTGPHVHEVTVESKKPVLKEVVSAFATLLPTKTSASLEDVVKAVAEVVNEDVQNS